MNLSESFLQSLPQDLKKLIEDLSSLVTEKNRRAVVVGGYVRDLMLAKKTLDLDLMLEDPAGEIVEVLKNKHHAKLTQHNFFKTFTLQMPSGLSVDVTTARVERYEAPAQLPIVTVENIQIENDLKRRDFSINTMALWLQKENFGELLDPLGGKNDLDQKIIRVLHDASFVDDPTRLYRGIRFAGRLGFTLEKNTESWIKSAFEKELPILLTPVRRRHEFELILMEENPIPIIETLVRLNGLHFIHQTFHINPSFLTVFSHRLQQLKNNPLDLAERWATWLRPWGSEQALEILTDLSAEKAVKKKVSELLAQ